MALSVAASLTSLTLLDYVPESYGGERLRCRIARGLFALEFLNLFMPHYPRPILEAEDARVASAATARTVHSPVALRILGSEPNQAFKSRSPLDSLPANRQ